MPTQSHCSRTQRRRGQESRVTIDVYDTALSFVILGVAPERVHHRPDAASLTPAAPGLPSFLLCPDFETAAGCMCGADCKYFHVDTTDLVRREIHVNRAWRSLDAVAYARTAARVKLSVYAPNHRQPIEQLDSATLLLTVGCEAALTYTPPVDAPCDGPVDLAAPSHCAHFYFNRMCNRGRTCRYIHAVHVDAAASDGDLAPQPPVILGLRGRRRMMESLTRECTNDVDFHVCSIDAEPFDEDPVNDVCGETESAPNSGNLDDDAVFAEMLRQAESRCAPASSSPVKEFVTVYRHDPYRRW